MIGTLAVGSRRRPRTRGFRLGLVAGLALPLVLLGASLIGGNSSTTDAPTADLAAERQALTDFEDELSPLVERGAATVVYGMRPGVTDIHQNGLDDATLVTMASGWVETMEGIRDDFAEIAPPSFLAEAASLYTDAFDAYAETARSLLAAAEASGEERQEHVTHAGEAGNRADALYDAAQADLARHRSRVGLGS